MFIRLYRKCKVIVSSWWGPRQALFHYAYKRKQRAHRKRTHDSISAVFFEPFSLWHCLQGETHRFGIRSFFASLQHDWVGLLPDVLVM